MLGKSTRRFFMGSITMGVLGLLLAAGVIAQLDPRNESDEYYDAVNDAACLEHHYEDGFVPFGFRFSEAYSELPVGETVPVTVEVFQASNFKGAKYRPHFIQNITVTLTLDPEEAKHVQVVTGSLPDPVEKEWGPEQVTHNDKFVSEKIFIGEGATEGRFSAEILSMDPPLDVVEKGELILNADSERKTSATGEVEIALDKDFFQKRGMKNYTFSASWRAPSGTAPITATVKASLEVTFDQDATEFTFTPDNPEVPLFTRDPPDRALIEIPLRFTSEEEAHLDFRIRANTYQRHLPEWKAPKEDGLYYRFLTMDVKGGEEKVVVAQREVATPVGEVVNLYNMLTRLFGSVALVLVITAMFTGGVFGKKSRQALNKASGGAKKRVLWHSTIGFLIVLVATAHFALALVETRNDISTGLLWGGIAWALLVSLGFTGYYQVRMIRKWSYKAWRRLHLWSAVAVLVFVLVHVLLEGSDLQGVRDLLPRGYERLIWPRV